ncbi:MAG: GNAT family N-acetyltransferase [Gammaproteobacteria bacterium]|nr:GNAT family N-acetyltransferase [Gammaproteobacteria bacterium]
MTQSSDITVNRVSGSALQQYIPALAQLRIEIFRDFPYLYDGTTEYEEQYLRTYSACEQAVIVLAMAGDQIVGASTGIPMAFETEEFKAPLISAGYDVNRVFYCAESVLRAPYRGLGLGWRFFDEREAHARELGGFDYSCFCAVERPQDHPRRPANYQPLDSLWHKRGYKKQPGLVTHYVWKDLDEADKSAKTMTYWIKSFR